MAPNFFIVGTTKGGTSSLDLWLRQHPDVGAPRRKEMHFFCACPNPGLHVADTMDDYLAAFPAGTAVGEASPCYLYYPDIPARLQSQFPGCRIIASLRDPVERFWSHYLMNEIYRPSGLAPEEVLERNLENGRTNALEDLFGMGLYAEQLERFGSVFGESMLVLFLEETAADAGAAMERVQRFLDLEIVSLDTSERDKEFVAPRGPVSKFFLQHPAPRAVGNALLPAKVRRGLKTRVLGDRDGKPQMEVGLRTDLMELYRPDSKRLEDLLDRPLPWSWHR